MNKENFIKGRIDYIIGKYNKHDDIEIWREYDTGWNYEQYLLPNLRPYRESLYLLANYNFGNEDYCKEFKLGYRQFHDGLDIESNPFIIEEQAEKYVQGWMEAKYLWDKVKSAIY